MSLLDETDLAIPGGKRGDWKNPLAEYNLDTPCVLIAATLAGLVEKRERGINIQREAPRRREIMEKNYGWPKEAVDLFERLASSYDGRMAQRLRKYHDDYKEYCGGRKELEVYIKCRKGNLCNTELKKAPETEPITFPRHDGS